MYKTFLKKLLRNWGYEIRRIPVLPQKPEAGFESVTFGTCTLRIPATSPLAAWYRQHPDYNAALKRVATLLVQKYPALGILDIGANIGDTFCIIRGEVPAKFICIEGDPIVFALLQENIAPYPDVIALNLFLGEDHQLRRVVAEKQGWNTTLIPTAREDAREIQFHTLDKVMDRYADAGDYKFLKIDTEGYDTRILRGSLRFLAQNRPVLFLEYNRDNMSRIGETGIDMLEQLRDHGYDQVLVYESMGRFLLATSLYETALIRQLHEYIDGKHSAIYYFDLCIFHQEDQDIAARFVAGEEHFRRYGKTH